MKNETTWLLVSDASRARVFSLHETPRTWALVATFEHAASRAPIHDLVTDKPGHTNTPHRGTYGSGLDGRSPHDVEVDRFARKLATFLGAHAAKGDFGRLVLAAPPKLLGLLRPHLGHAARRRVVLELVHDYTALAPRELDGRLKEAERAGRARARRGAQDSAVAWEDR